MTKPRISYDNVSGVWYWSCSKCAQDPRWRDSSYGWAKNLVIVAKRSAAHFYRHKGRYGS